MLKAQPICDMVHDSDNLGELWHKRMEHLHHETLPILREIITDFIEFTIE